MDITIYFYNRTPTPDVWTTLATWNGVNTNRYEVLDLQTLNGTTQFIWGNTTYYWTVNATNSSGNWKNKTYHYTTIQIATGANARYDMDKDTVVDVFDLNQLWTHRTGGSYSYDGMYDVDNYPGNGDGTLDVFDLNKVWNGRS